MGTVYGVVFKNGPPIYNDNDELISHFSQYEDHQREIPIVLVQMDEDDYLIESCIKNVPRIVPFGPMVGDKKTIAGKYNRCMIPLLPASARTANSVQGVTAKYGVVVDPGMKTITYLSIIYISIYIYLDMYKIYTINIGSNFFAGDYVAISRATTLDTIIMLNAVTMQNFTNHPSFRLKILQFYMDLQARFP